MKTYTEAELVEFGNYLLSDKRKEMVKEEHSQMVHHSDLENWNGISKFRVIPNVDKNFLFTTPNP